MPKNNLIDIVKSIARDVYQKLGSGFSEYVYDRAMQVGLRLKGLKYENQRVIQITYKKHVIGEGYPDLVVNAGGKKLVVEIKSIGSLGPAEEQQLKNYLKSLKINHGLLINFPYPGGRQSKTKVEIKEVNL